MRISDWSSDVCSSDLVEELGILSVGLIQDLGAPPLALAAQDAGLAICLRLDYRCLAVSRGGDALGLLEALSTELRRLALTLRAHAVVNRFPSLVRQVGAPDAHVDQRDAKPPGLLVDAFPQIAQNLGALLGEHRREQIGRAHV